MYISHEMNKHNCQLCKHEFCGCCLGKKYGEDVSLDNEPCDEYEFGGTEERLHEIETQKSDIEKRKPCINYEDGCEEWAGCPCVYYKAESKDKG